MVRRLPQLQLASQNWKIWTYQQETSQCCWKIDGLHHLATSFSSFCHWGSWWERRKVQAKRQLQQQQCQPRGDRGKCLGQRHCTPLGWDWAFHTWRFCFPQRELGLGENCRAPSKEVRAEVVYARKCLGMLRECSLTNFYTNPCCKIKFVFLFVRKKDSKQALLYNIMNVSKA